MMQHQFQLQHQPVQMVKSEPVPPAAKQVVHVRDNSDNLTEQLFRIALNPSANHTKPLRERGLPASFFHPRPSNDVNHNHQPQQIIPEQHHMRFHSSPAMLQPMHLGAAPIMHPRQNSCDILDGGGKSRGRRWEKAVTSQGEHYYLDHVNCRTVWEDPRKATVDEEVVESKIALAPNAVWEDPAKMPVVEQKISLPPNVPPLPPNWDYGYDPNEARFYYIDHNTERTTWFHPLMPNKEEQVPSDQEKAYTQYLVNQQRQQQQQMIVPNEQFMDHRPTQQPQVIQQHFQPQQHQLAQPQPPQQLYLPPQSQHQMPHQAQGQKFAPMNQQQMVMMQQQAQAHQRQESADSGVGLRTPENYLSAPFEEMDTQEQMPSVPVSNGQQQQSNTFPLDEIEPSITIDTLTWL